MKPFDHKSFLARVGHHPGVYLMFDERGASLYVGKAKDLNKRLQSYFSNRPMQSKTQVMVSKIDHIEIIATTTEAEALLLESNLIKEKKPRYNVALRDNKSYPYIYIDTSHAFPRLGLYRGHKKIPGKLYGPYPSASSVRATLTILQKMFAVRQCEDSYYSNRSRPCLQYQIKRCTAPCVNYIDQPDYAKAINMVELFLEGKTNILVDQLGAQMMDASKQLDYESAAKYRDLISNVNVVAQEQHIEAGQQNVDVFGLALGDEYVGVCVSFIRSGRMVGDKRFLLKNTLGSDMKGELETVILQYYQNKSIPKEMVISASLDGLLLSQSIEKLVDYKVAIQSNPRGVRLNWLKMSEENAWLNLQQKTQNVSAYTQKLSRLKDVFKMELTPATIACIDISHTMGQQTRASCVVFDNKGAAKSQYRLLKIDGITPGDDYAAIAQATRRYLKHLHSKSKDWPEIMFIDGGKGQLSKAFEAYELLAAELGVSIQPLFIGIAKDDMRTSGKERLFIYKNNVPIILPANDPGFLLIQQLRDEAHRFAISAHRKARAKQQTHSILEDIPNIGASKRQALLNHFGGLQGIKEASVTELKKVSGISEKLAQTIYHFMH